MEGDRRRREGRSERWKKWEYMSCDRKKKFKSSEASKFADKWGQRKYECHVCGHWHLTKHKGD